MKWEGHEQSRNVEDRRGPGAGDGAAPRRLGGRGIGLGSIVIALLAGWLFGINPLTVLGVLSGGGGQQTPVQVGGPAPAPPREDKAAAFASTVLRDTEIVWGQQFQATQAQYREPKLVLFRGATPTACGTGQSAMGPFYCPGDAKVYIDLDFFDTLARRMGAPGDFAQAYVIAHEVGHHVQNLLGLTAKVDAQRGRLPAAQMNALSVRLELQADCFAGVWAHHSQRGKNWLDASDIEEALNAAAQIGDDTLQRRSQGHVVPESFTHGTSAQRVEWFKRGLQSGSMARCNTFDRGRS
ncbi:MAG: neutral zinc metallopeptidase [Aquabacterium sp.]